jgi:hypothetical protein
MQVISRTVSDLLIRISPESMNINKPTADNP